MKYTSCLITLVLIGTIFFGGLSYVTFLTISEGMNQVNMEKSAKYRLVVWGHQNSSYYVNSYIYTNNILEFNDVFHYHHTIYGPTFEVYSNQNNQ